MACINHRLEPWYSFPISNRKLTERKSTQTIAIVSILNISSLSIFLNNLNKMNQRSSSYIHALVKQVRIMKQKRRGWQIYKFQIGIQTAISTTKSLFLQTQYTEGALQSQKLDNLKCKINLFVHIFNKKDSLHIFGLQEKW